MPWHFLPFQGYSIRFLESILTKNQIMHLSVLPHNSSAPRHQLLEQHTFRIHSTLSVVVCRCNPKSPKKNGYTMVPKIVLLRSSKMKVYPHYLKELVPTLFVLLELQWFSCCILRSCFLCKDKFPIPLLVTLFDMSHIILKGSEAVIISAF